MIQAKLNLWVHSNTLICLSDYKKTNAVILPKFIMYPRSMGYINFLVNMTSVNLIKMMDFPQASGIDTVKKYVMNVYQSIKGTGILNINKVSFGNEGSG